MTEDDPQPPARRMAELSEETRGFLSDLTRDDIQTIQAGLPILKMVIGFGRVARWMAIALLSIMAGVLMLGESIQKIIGWVRQ